MSNFSTYHNWSLPFLMPRKFIPRNSDYNIYTNIIRDESCWAPQSDTVSKCMELLEFEKSGTRFHAEIREKIRVVLYV